MKIKTNLHILSTLLLLSFICNISLANFPRYTDVPVERLITNISAYTKEHPDEAQGYYTLGRVHYLAFINKSLTVSAFRAESRMNLPMIPSDWDINRIENSKIYVQARKLAAEELGYSSSSEIPENMKEKYNQLYQKKIKELQVQPPKPDPNQISQEELIKHVSKAIKNFKKAIDIDKKNGLSYLGLASLYEQYLDYVKITDIKKIPADINNITIEQTREAYLSTYEVSVDDDLKPKRPPAMSLVSREAGQAFVRLTEQKSQLSEMEESKLTEINQILRKLPSSGGILTPIIFSFEIPVFPQELLQQRLQVKFDLNGDGAEEVWPWVKHSTGILVWNEDGKGEITSGRQLFGSVTWWLFFNDGYHALDCLDDNRDSDLSGDELKGISVWFDTNSNGKSESEEIKSLEELGIISISTKSTSTENGWPANKTGITLKTGKIIPTYDWIAKPFSNKSNI